MVRRIQMLLNRVVPEGRCPLMSMILIEGSMQLVSGRRPRMLLQAVVLQSPLVDRSLMEHATGLDAVVLLDSAEVLNTAEMLSPTEVLRSPHVLSPTEVLGPPHVLSTTEVLGTTDMAPAEAADMPSTHVSTTTSMPTTARVSAATMPAVGVQKLR